MITYKEDWIFELLFQRKGSVAQRAFYFAFPCALISLLMVLMDNSKPLSVSVSGQEISRQSLGMSQLTKSQLWTASTAIIGLLLSFRTHRAMARFWEGTGLLHQMRGEWFDSISCCVTFSHMALLTKKQEVLCFRHTLVRLMSLCHGSALEEIAGDSAGEVDTIDPFGLDEDTLNYLNDCKHVYNFNRVEALLHMTQTIITKSLDEGILKIPPPILSRVYQTLSRGFVNLLNAKKIADTRFPFPYAQLISILFAVHMLATPLLISCLVPHLVWAPIFTFVPVFAMASVNLISIELENPFGNDANDLPLEHFQGEMNKCLMMLLHPSADIVAGVAEHRCIFDFQELARQFHGEEENGFGWDNRRGGATQRLSTFRQVVNSSSSFGSDYDRTSSIQAVTPHTSLEAALKRINPSSSEMIAASSSKTPPKNVSYSCDTPPSSCPDSDITFHAIHQIDRVSEDCDDPADASPAIFPNIGRVAEACKAIRVPMYDKSGSLTNLAPLFPLKPSDMAKRDFDEETSQELKRSLKALKEFTDSLTLVLQSMISRGEETLLPMTSSSKASLNAHDKRQSKVSWHPSVKNSIPNQEPWAESTLAPQEPDPLNIQDMPPSPRTLQQLTNGEVIAM